VGGEIFLTCPDRPWGPPKLPVQWVPGLPRGYSGRGLDHLPIPGAEIKERVQLYLYPQLFHGMLYDYVQCTCFIYLFPVLCDLSPHTVIANLHHFLFYPVPSC
jgi:hypothetical protein